MRGLLMGIPAHRCLEQRGLDMVVQGCDHGAPVPGSREHLLGDEGFLGSSFLVARALDAVGLV